MYCQTTNQVKIGYSTNVERRLKQLSTGNPNILTVIALLGGDKRLEKELHFKFRHYRINREWFNFQPIMVTEFERLVKFFPIL